MTITSAPHFGGHHTATYAYIAFLIEEERMQDVMHCAEVANVGLKIDTLGIPQIFSNGDECFIRFAEAALALHHRQAPR